MSYEGDDLSYPTGPFEKNYYCYPPSYIDKPHLENGDKVIMPPSALDRLASLHVDYPMLFEVSNPTISRTINCGVLEFVAEEGVMFMPHWMMQNLLLQEGDIVKVKSATLPKGTFVKLQPHTQEFFNISNPKAVLENTLRQFSCLTVGNKIMLAYNNKKYYIDILEAKPASAISVIETDCEVDFAPPLDYEEPEEVCSPTVTSKAFSEVSKDERENPEPKFSAFSGTGRRLDGKDSVQPQPCSSHVESSATAPSPCKGAAPSSDNSVVSSPKKQFGRLVFGARNSNAASKPNIQSSPPTREEVKSDTTKAGPKTFQAFIGKKYSLKD